MPASKTKRQKLKLSAPISELQVPLTVAPVGAGSPGDGLVVLPDHPVTQAPQPAGTDPEPERPVFNPHKKKIFYYRISVGVQVAAVTTNIKISTVKTYLVGAPSQCSAMKHTALLPEVREILNVIGKSEVLTAEERASLKLETDQECPPI